ncbi:hypothetical protein I7X30_07450 [Capnocytophaga sp. 051621]|uniref:Uncharacterized protein n=2 Tax=Capnocytophaga periodontitidis TaxID=2795027 RepID=A0ABS0SMV8_9FLAO|nr:hypothetical protein [uncultured Capnocytophaga sp.]MBI1646890.1 hypothetical protein [Capnocytophaga periodontitidis]
MMDVLYYYIYLFYVKVMPDDYPHSNTVWALGFIFSLIINGLIDIPLAYFFNCYLSTIQKVIIIIIVMTLFYLKYDRSGKGIRIVKKEKPKFFGSNTASIILTILFFLIGMLFLFFKVEVMIKILEMNKATTSPM